MKRRNFLKGSAALFLAPAIVRAESLMKIWVPPETKIYSGVAGKYVTQFGAMPDPFTIDYGPPIRITMNHFADGRDRSADFQAAFDLAAKLDSGIITVPTGQYLITARTR